MLSRFLKAGGKVEWHEHSDTAVAATFTHAAGGSIRVDWDLGRAEQAGLAGRNNWRKFPRQMLRARVISEGVRAVYPVATGGMYVPEEVQDFKPETSVTAYIEPAPEMQLEDALAFLRELQTTTGFKERVQELAKKIPGKDVEQLKIDARKIYAEIREIEKMTVLSGPTNE